MKKPLLWVNILILFNMVFIGPVMAEKKPLPMPPHLDLNAKPKVVLGKYPLGMITRNAAFSHHGGAHRKIVLPNQMEGWVFNVGGNEWHRTYTVVINKDGVVADVIYYDHTKNADHGLTAMQMQSKNLIVGHPRTGSGP